MAGMNFDQKISAAKDRMREKPMEYAGGKDLLQPDTICNSGSRKLMHAVHRDHIFPLINGEKAIGETGYEIRYGDRSSSVTTADSDYIVVNRISKFSFSPNHHYFLILKDTKTNRLEVQERIMYRHITESYGYLFNNEFLDSLQVGSFIPEGQIVQKSVAFDEYNNRRDGLNTLVGYMNLDANLEDSILISDDYAWRARSPLLKYIEIPINENDIPLNIYGDDKVYKIFPDIGEDIEYSKLLILRKEKKEESLFAQARQRLRKQMMSDDPRLLDGKVIDVNIRCNNPANLDGPYYGQLKMYYQEQQRFCSEIVTTVTPYVAQGFKLTYELQKLFANSKRQLNKDQYIKKKPFSNIILEIAVLEERMVEIGDKFSDRYGGKGVVSKIIPKELMPRINGRPLDMIKNASTMYNRENPGQTFEVSWSHISGEIVRYIAQGHVGVEEALKMVSTYLGSISPDLEKSMQEYVAEMSMEEKMFYLENIVDEGYIHYSAKPFSEATTIQKLEHVYQLFPWIEQNKVEVPIRGSNGSIRFVEARRRMVIGMQYMFRLKQFAEEKFSATAMSATNLTNENTKTRASRNYRSYYSDTPIRFGNMESNDMNHMGSEPVVVNLMIHSVSPQARRLVEQMYTGDPIAIDIKLDSDSSNRGAEKVNTFLKAIGKRLWFRKKKKIRRKGITFSPIRFFDTNIKDRQGIYFMPTKSFDPEEEQERREKDQLTLDPGSKKCTRPIWFDGRNRNEKGEVVE